ncbi:MAG: NAD-dependent epimerase/dehydratase family protein [Desulfatirhabdiaceae bacterium]
MNILITGGCGYIGSILTPRMLDDGHTVTVIDIQWFGNHLQPHPNLTIIQDDIRNIDALPMAGVDAIVHLANIANDPGVELNPVLSWEVNVLAAQQIADRAARSGVRQIVYGSSGSVYGVKDDPQVTEDLTLVPITAYNKTKMVAERVLLSYKDQMRIHNIRPATVCGWSPRMRLDLSVNMLTMQALKNGRITVFGGQQTRPNIHIQDMVRVYQHFLTHPELPCGCYNAGFENISILDIANRVQAKVPADIVITESNDPRSYRQNSDKLLATGFIPMFTVDDAMNEIIETYRTGQLIDSDQCHTVKWMKHMGLNG